MKQSRYKVIKISIGVVQWKFKCSNSKFKFLDAWCKEHCTTQIRWVLSSSGSQLVEETHQCIKCSINAKKCHSNRQDRSVILLRGTAARINLEKPPYHLSTQKAQGKCTEAESKHRLKEPARFQCLEKKVYKK